MTRHLILVSLVMGCSGDGEQPDAPPVEQIEQLPVLQITNPARAAFLPPGEVQVQGQVIAGDADIDTLVSKGIEINPEPTGEFSQTLPLDVGLNILGTRVEDVAGKRAVDGRGFYWGPSYSPGEYVKKGLRIRIGPELLDDNDPDLDDIASLAELLATDSSIYDLIIGETIEDDQFDLIITGLTVNSAEVDITPKDAFIDLKIRLNDFWMSFDIENILGQSYLNTQGSTWSDGIDLTLQVALSMAGGSIETSSAQAETSLDGFGITVDSFPDFLEGYLADWVEDYLKEAAAEAVNDEVAELLAELIEGLTADADFGEVQLFTSLNEVEIKETGIRLTADMAAEGADLSTLPDGAGSPKTESDAPDWSDIPEGPISVAVDDDMVNQFIFALWGSGELSGFEFSGTELALLAGAPIEAPLGPVSSASLDVELPPMLRKPTEPSMTADMGMGEMRLRVYREDGQIHDFSINTWLGATVSLTETGNITLDFDSRPKYIPMEIGVLAWDPALDPGDLAALTRLMMPPLFGRAATLAPSFETPTLPLGETLGIEGLEDIQLRLKEADFAFNENNWLILNASLEGVQ